MVETQLDREVGKGAPEAKELKDTESETVKTLHGLGYGLLPRGTAEGDRGVLG